MSTVVNEQSPDEQPCPECGGRSFLIAGDVAQPGRWPWHYSCGKCHGTWPPPMLNPREWSAWPDDGTLL